MCCNFGLKNFNAVQMFVPGIDIWDSLHPWEESKQQHSFQEIGFQLVTALSGSGILCMLGNSFKLLSCRFSINVI